MVPLRHALAAIVVLAMALAAAPAQDSRKPPAGKADRGLIGLSVFSSDGVKIGRVVEIGIDDDNQAVLVAEIERPLGIGSDAVAIPVAMFVRKSNRIELTITAAEVGDRISRAGRAR